MTILVLMEPGDASMETLTLARKFGTELRSVRMDAIQPYAPDAVASILAMVADDLQASAVLAAVHVHRHWMIIVRRDPDDHARRCAKSRRTDCSKLTRPFCPTQVDSYVSILPKGLTGLSTIRRYTNRKVVSSDDLSLWRS